MVIYMGTGNRVEKCPRRGGSLPVYYRLAGILGREVAHMTGYELLMAVLAFVSAVAGVGCLVVALLNFLKERNQRK